MCVIYVVTTEYISLCCVSNSTVPLLVLNVNVTVLLVCLANTILIHV